MDAPGPADSSTLRTWDRPAELRGTTWARSVPARALRAGKEQSKVRESLEGVISKKHWDLCKLKWRKEATEWRKQTQTRLRADTQEENK